MAEEPASTGPSRLIPKRLRLSHATGGRDFGRGPARDSATGSVGYFGSLQFGRHATAHCQCGPCARTTARGVESVAPPEFSLAAQCTTGVGCELDDSPDLTLWLTA